MAKLSMDVQEDVTLAVGYKLKLNSYDLGVDLELADAIQRIRFEHPEVRAVIITSQAAYLLRGGEYLYARHVVACLQSQLLQIYERDALRH